MRKVVIIVAMILAVSFSRTSPGATWYVDYSVSVSGEGKSRETAFKTIQEGINAASVGDTVVVAEGTYVENIKVKGKNITLTGTSPCDPAVVAKTIIDGNKGGSVVAFDGTETETCLFTGFTIQNGKAYYGGGIAGGTQDRQCLATIRNNVFLRNRADGG